MTRFVVPTLLAVALFLFALPGCDEKKGRFTPNKPPHVELTVTPAEGELSRYDVEFFWNGWDSDGEVDYFLYAIDPPEMSGTADSVWTRTDDYSGRFIFTASDFDTLYPSTRNQIAKGWHVFAIKAVDDWGAVSAPEYMAFNAATIAPQTTITAPPPVGAIEHYQGAAQDVGLRVTMRWEGIDADGIHTDEPVGYYYKAVDVTGVTAWGNLAAAVWQDTTKWARSSASTTRVTLDLDDAHNYALAVRSIDEASAVEPVLLLNKNMLWVRASQLISQPELGVHSTAFGMRRWTGWTADTETYEVPVGSQYEFTLHGDAGWYGGLIAGFSYAWDLEDLETQETHPDGEGAWTPWSLSRNRIVATFDLYEDRHLFVRCKDDAGGITLSTMRFKVVTLDPSKRLGYIDDWRKYPETGFNGEPLDDAVWQSMLRGYNYGNDWEDIVWDEWEAPWGEDMPSLEFLSQFSVLVWSLNDNRSMSVNSKSAWFTMNELNTMNVLAVYLRGESPGGEKGKVWAYGRGVVESSILPYSSRCGYPYRVNEFAALNACGIRRGSFAFDLMHIVGDFSAYDPRSGGTQVNLFSEASDRPTHVYLDADGPGLPAENYSRPPAAQLYPGLPRRLEPHPDWMNRSKFITFEVLDFPEPGQEVQEIFYDPERNAMTDLIPLYKYSASDQNSYSHNKYCAFRYLPSMGSTQGEMVYFFFPMFPFKDDQIRATAKVVLSDWFGLPDPDAGDGESAAVGTITN